MHAKKFMGEIMRETGNDYDSDVEIGYMLLKKKKKNEENILKLLKTHI